MMTNIFSMFDPASSSIFSLNWISMMTFMSFMPYTYFKTSRRHSMLTMNYLFFMNMNMKKNMKKTNFKLLLVLTMTAVLITSMNLLSLIPFYFTPTAHISMTMSLSLTFWCSLNIKNWINSSDKMLMHLVPNSTPQLLCPFMVVIESISNTMRPLTLSVRLSANMVAGHVLMSLMSQTLSMSLFISQNTFPVLNLLTMLEISVAFIQGYVFVILLSLYFNEI